ncbi:MAG TPA: acetoin utilization protein acuB [Flavobacteriaceae bacterium]|nr:acetoin utilization protein acuB [Flavobacteriaceae bacterium]
MNLPDYIINDINPLKITDKVSDAQMLFNQLTYSHIPVQNEDNIYIGCVSETDAHCFERDKKLSDYSYALEGFFVKDYAIWLNVLEAFAQNTSNIMPVLNDKNQYLGYYELNDIIGLFNETPFFAEAGGILVVEKGVNDYTFSELSQIVETHNGKILGVFISRLENDRVQLTLKISGSDLNEIIQGFRRYSYTIVSGHEDDSFAETLKERSEYLKKYLDI